MFENMRMSYSRVKKYLTCPLRYKHEYIDGNWPPSKPFFLEGNVLHEVMKELNLGIMAHGNKLFPLTFVDDGLPFLIKKKWERQVEMDECEDIDQPEEVWERIRKLVTSFVDQGFHKFYEVQGAEEKQERVLPNGIVLVGIPDVQTPDGFVEYKTSKTSWPYHRPLNEFQGEFMGILTGQESQTLDMHYFVFVKTKDPKVQHIRKIITPEDMKRALALMDTVAEGIESEMFYPNNGMFCSPNASHCWGVCRSWEG